MRQYRTPTVYGKTRVKKISLAGLAIITLGTLLFFNWRSDTPSTSRVESSTPPPKASIRYSSQNLPQGTAHIILIPANNNYSVTPVVSEKLITVEDFAKKYPSIAVFNAGFFDPINEKTTSYITLQGKLVADPKANERLLNNPKLQPYLSKILNRTEFRRYQCADKVRYDIVLHSEATPAECKLVDALGAGPRLLPKLTLEEEGFVDLATGRDAIGSTQANARTAIGITGDGSILLIMVAQKPNSSNNPGISLPALADLIKTLGVEKAMNLDGGSSSSFFYQGKNFYGKVDASGNPIKRPVKSVLLVRS